MMFESWVDSFHNQLFILGLSVPTLLLQTLLSECLGAFVCLHFENVVFQALVLDFRAIIINHL